MSQTNDNTDVAEAQTEEIDVIDPENTEYEWMHEDSDNVRYLIIAQPEDNGMNNIEYYLLRDTETYDWIIANRRTDYYPSKYNVKRVFDPETTDYSVTLTGEWIDADDFKCWLEDEAGLRRIIKDQMEDMDSSTFEMYTPDPAGCYTVELEFDE